MFVHLEMQNSPNPRTFLCTRTHPRIGELLTVPTSRGMEKKKDLGPFLLCTSSKVSEREKRVSSLHMNSHASTYVRSPPYKLPPPPSTHTPCEENTCKKKFRWKKSLSPFILFSSTLLRTSEVRELTLPLLNRHGRLSIISHFLPPLLFCECPLCLSHPGLFGTRLQTVGEERRKQRSFRTLDQT